MAQSVAAPESTPAAPRDWRGPVSALPFVLFLAGYFIAPRFAGVTHLTTLIFLGINVLLALGLNLLMGYAGQVSLGHAAFFGMGAYTSAILTVRPIPENVIPGMAAGIGVMAGVAAVISLCRASGWKLVAAAGVLVGLAMMGNAFIVPLPAFVALFVVVMAAFGVFSKMGWRQCGGAGLIAAAVIVLTDWFLKGTLARGGTSPWTGMVVGVGFTGLVAYLIGGQVLRLKGHYLAMATLAFGVIVEIVFRQWTDVTGGSSDGIFGIPTIDVSAGMPRFAQKIMAFSVGGPPDARQQYYFLVWGLVFIALLLASNIVKSRIGRAFRAVHGSEVAAESLGVDTSRYKVQVFVLSAALASIAGSLYAHNAGIGYINPSEFSFMASVQLVVIVVVGGMASIWGALLGATVIQLLKDWMLTLERHNPEVFGLTIKGLDPIVFGAVLILMMIVLPSGLARGLSDLASAFWRVIQRLAPAKRRGKME